MTGPLVPVYFLDTSALAKLYRKEVGSDFIDRIVSELVHIALCRDSLFLEMESVLGLKFRAGEIDEQALLGGRRLRVAALNDANLCEVRRLLTVHARTMPFRGPDALQLFQ
jgi:hypothetical protein